MIANRPSVLLTLVVFSVFSLASGCSRGPDKDVVLAPSLSLTHGKIKVFLGENEIGLIELESSAPLKAPPRISLTDFRAHILGPNGWKDCGVTVQEIGARYQLNLAIPSTTVFYVDLDDRGHVEVTLGEMEFKITRAQAKKIVIVGPEKLIGSKIDKKNARAIEGGKVYLIDPSGKHSYQFRQVSYLRAAWVFPGMKIDPPANVFEPALMHELPGSPDFFLEKAPERLEGGTGHVKKTELTRVK